MGLIKSNSLKNTYKVNETRKKKYNNRRKTQSYTQQQYGGVVLSMLEFVKLEMAGKKTLSDGSTQDYFNYANGSELFFHDFKILWELDKNEAKLKSQNYRNIDNIEEYYEDWYQYLKQYTNIDPLDDDNKGKGLENFFFSSCYMNSLIQTLLNMRDAVKNIDMFKEHIDNAELYKDFIIKIHKNTIKNDYEKLQINYIQFVKNIGFDRGGEQDICDFFQKISQYLISPLINFEYKEFFLFPNNNFKYDLATNSGQYNNIAIKYKLAKNAYHTSYIYSFKTHNAKAANKFENINDNDKIYNIHNKFYNLGELQNNSNKYKCIMNIDLIKAIRVGKMSKYFICSLKLFKHDKAEIEKYQEQRKVDTNAQHPIAKKIQLKINPYHNICVWDYTLTSKPADLSKLKYYYEPISVNYHIGSGVDSGHYINFSKKKDADTYNWYRYSDDIFLKWENKDIKEDDKTSTPYLMVYKLNDVFYSFDNLGLINSLKYYVARQDYTTNDRQIEKLIELFNNLVDKIKDMDNDDNVLYEYEMKNATHPVYSPYSEEAVNKDDGIKVKDFKLRLADYFKDLAKQYNQNVIKLPDNLNHISTTIKINAGKLQYDDTDIDNTLIQYVILNDMFVLHNLCITDADNVKYYDNLLAQFLKQDADKKLSIINLLKIHILRFIFENLIYFDINSVKIAMNIEDTGPDKATDEALDEALTLSIAADKALSEALDKTEALDEASDEALDEALTLSKASDKASDKALALYVALAFKASDKAFDDAKKLLNEAYDTLLNSIDYKIDDYNTATAASVYNTAIANANTVYAKAIITIINKNATVLLDKLLANYQNITINKDINLKIPSVNADESNFQYHLFSSMHEFIEKSGDKETQLLFTDTEKKNICIDELKEINKYNTWVSYIYYQLLLQNTDNTTITTEILNNYAIKYPYMNGRDKNFKIYNNEEFQKQLEYSYTMQNMEDKEDEYEIYVNNICTNE